MVRRVGLLAVLALSVSLVAASTAAACHGGGRGGCGGGHHGCGGGDCGGCGVAYGGCGGCGGCGVAYGGCGDCGGCGGMAYAAMPAWGDGAMYTAAPASLAVTLPEGATLTVNGQVIPSVAGTQVLATPAINFGQDYHYTVRIQVTQDGRTVALTRAVNVHAGEQTQVDLDLGQAIEVAAE